MLELTGLITAHVCAALSDAFGAAYYAGSGTSQTLALLCKLNRYVYADIPRFSRRGADELRALTGASVILEPSPERVLKATLAVLELPAAGRKFSRSCVVYATRESYYDSAEWSRRVGGVKAGLNDNTLRDNFTLAAAGGAIRRRSAELGGIIILTKRA
jgi:hypothetical protein